MLDVTRASTLDTLLSERASSQRDWDVRLLHVTEQEQRHQPGAGDGDSLALSFADIHSMAGRAAARLLRGGVRDGDRVLLVLPTGLTFVVAFFACQRLGAIPVPVVPPWSTRSLRTHLARIAGIAELCDPATTVIAPELADRIRAAAQDHDERWLSTNVIAGEELLCETDTLHVATASSDGPAIIQFTSGSTGRPKGVVLTHRALIANAYGIGLAIGLGPDDIACSWLPLFHDMGLIGHLIFPLLWGMQSVLMPPEVFMRSPRTWLRAISRYRATVSTAPNFAYELCQARASQAEIEALDLSCWRVAMCGGEPVLASTIERFAQRFETAAFRSESMRPVYGLAETCLGAAFSDPQQCPRVDVVRRDRFERARAADAAPNDLPPEETLRFVSVGRALPGHELRVVDENAVECPQRVEGEIEIRGPSLMAGYHADRAATDEAFRAGWLRTGDAGYLAQGELFVTGRAKELIVKGGRNVYPYDVEAAAAQVRGIRAGRCAAFGVPNPERGTDDLILVCETRLRDVAERGALERAVMAEAFEHTGMRPDRVLLTRPDSLSKTSSGKMRRTAVRERYLQGDLD